MASTIENDGSVSGDPCQLCSGELVLRSVQSGGFFLGCSKYSLGCVFKMSPNSEELGALAEERAIKRAAREKKRAERDAEARTKAQVKAQKELASRPHFCEKCFSRLSNVDVQAKRANHSWC